MILSNIYHHLDDFEELVLTFVLKVLPTSFNYIEIMASEFLWIAILFTSSQDFLQITGDVFYLIDYEVVQLFGPIQLRGRKILNFVYIVLQTH